MRWLLYVVFNGCTKYEALTIPKIERGSQKFKMGHAPSR